jgi:16S rRNA (uracil1498-N3)-methyltransferase
LLRAYNPRLIIPPVARRIHIPVLRPGEIPLDSVQAHHARDVLRLADGAQIDVFDDAGRSAQGVLHIAPGTVNVRIDHVHSPEADAFQWTVAAAVPKGDRADWMVEKLSELGAVAFIPLAAARSVVLPEGKGKRERWARIATESAKQCRRPGVMRIEDLTTVDQTIKKVRASANQNDASGSSTSEAWFFATEISGIAMGDAIARLKNVRSLTLIIGPEGGWTMQEISEFESAGIVAVRLGATILRIETAAIAAGAVVSTLMPGL